MNEAQIARDEAIERVEGSADVRFNECADQAVIEAARRHKEITTDDVKRYCAMTPDEPRAFGPAMIRAARNGIIERTDRTRQSESRVCHAREQRIWRSLIYQTQPVEAPRPIGNLFGVELEVGYPAN